MFSNKIFICFCVSLLTPAAFSAGYANRCPFLKTRAEGQSESEQNAADRLCAPPSISCDANDIYYSMDGSCNNLNNPSWGQVGTAFARLLPANYSDGISKLRAASDGGPLPLTRILRRALLPDENVNSKRRNIMFYGFGQYLTHDLILARRISTSDRCCVNNKPVPDMNEEVCLPTIIPKDDPLYSRFGVTCLEFTRVINTQSSRCNGKPIFQINSQTAFMDLSMNYGTSDADLRLLRTGKGGQLKVTNDINTSGQEFPRITSGPRCPNGGVDRRPGGDCFLAGDERINQNPEILVVDVIFFKLHNLVAKYLQTINPRWNDERLFQETRRICIAMYQHVISAEYLPVLIGPDVTSLYKLFPATSGHVRGYNEDLNPQTLSSYAGAVGRAGHSNIIGYLKYNGADGRPESYRLRDKFFNNSFLLRQNMFSNILQSFVEQPANRQDQYFTQEINNWMFQRFNQSFGFDLSAVDILRGRDYGLQPYNKFREACGLCPLKRFEDLADEIRRPEDVKILKSLYKSVDDIDLYIGGLLEKPLPGSTYGQTFSCIQAESFYRWKYGDRLFYEFPEAKFSTAQLNSIRKTTWSSILCLTNPGLRSIQSNSFLLECSTNPRVQCREIPTIDLNFWRE